MKGIYCYVDKKNDTVVYVGKDSNIGTNTRHKAHLRPSHYDIQPFNRILQNNPDRYEYRKLVELSDDFNDKDLNDLEEYFIEEFNTYHYDNPRGFNFTLGGEGMTGYKHTDEYCKQLSERNKKMWEDEEYRQKVSQKFSENHADFSGMNHPRAKYGNLWDIKSVIYYKKCMFQNGREPNPCKCFEYKYKCYRVPIGYFHDFLTPEIINNLVENVLE